MEIIHYLQLVLDNSYISVAFPMAYHFIKSLILTIPDIFFCEVIKQMIHAFVTMARNIQDSARETTKYLTTPLKSIRIFHGF